MGLLITIVATVLVVAFVVRLWPNGAADRKTIREIAERRKGARR